MKDDIKKIREILLIAPKLKELKPYIDEVKCIKEANGLTVGEYYRVISFSAQSDRIGYIQVKNNNGAVYGYAADCFYLKSEN